MENAGFADILFRLCHGRWPFFKQKIFKVRIIVNKKTKKTSIHILTISVQGGDVVRRFCKEKNCWNKRKSNVLPRHKRENNLKYMPQSLIRISSDCILKCLLFQLWIITSPYKSKKALVLELQMQLWEGYVTVHFEKEKLLKIKAFFIRHWK